MPWVLLVAYFFQASCVAPARAQWFNEYPTLRTMNGSRIIPPGYDRNEFPPLPGGGPMRVYIKFALENILDIDEWKERLDYQIYLSIYWPDTRLMVDELANTTFASLTLSPSLEKEIWVPDLMIYNLHEMERVTLLRQLGGLVVFKNKYIKIGLYARATVTCNMDFTAYPFDTQTCYIRFGSYGHIRNQMLLNWMPRTVNIYSNDQLTRKNFQVTLKREKPFNACYGAGSANCYSILLVTVKLRRNLAFFIWHTIMPCILLVMTSWFSMLLPPEVIPGRMVLCITSLLALLTLFTTSLRGLEVSYLRASDLWYVGCLIFDFLITLEYVILLFVQRRLKETSETQVETWVRPNSVHPDKKHGQHEQPQPPRLHHRAHRAVVAHLHNPNQLDRVCRWILAALFVSFNIGYWTWVYTRLRVDWLELKPT